MEIEAKFAVPDEATYNRLQDSRQLAGYTLQPKPTKENRDRYLDTPGRRFLAAGYFCRLRSEGDGYLITLKGLGEANGAIHRRDEREVKLAEPDLDPAHWPDSPATWLAQEIAAKQPLQPLFELRQMRAKRLVVQGERQIGELTIDAVEVEQAHAGREQPPRYYELEIELMGDGTEADLERLGAELKSDWGLNPEPRSKFERASATLGLTAAPQPGTREVLAPDEQSALEQYAQGPRVWARRAAVVLGWASGQPTREVAGSAGLSTGRARFWVRAWRGRRLGIFTRHRAQQPSVNTGGAGTQEEEAVMAGQSNQDGDRQTDRAADELMVEDAERAQMAPNDQASQGQEAQQAGSAVPAAGASVAAGPGDAPAAEPGGESGSQFAEPAAAAQAATATAAQPELGASGEDQGAAAVSDAAQASNLPTSKASAKARRLAAMSDAAQASGLPNSQAPAGDQGSAAMSDTSQAPDQAESEVSGETVPAEAEPPAAEEADPLEWLKQPVRRDDAMPEAGRKVMYIHFQRMCQNEEGTRSGEDTENLHDMRVSTRRLRAAYLLFEPYFEAKAFGQFNKQLRKTGRMLGTVRDLDVLIEKAEHYQDEHELPAPGLEPLAHAWHEQRDNDRAQLVDYLDSKKYRRFVEDFEKFLTTPGEGAIPIADGEPVAYEVRHVVPRLIMGRYEDVRAYERLLPDSPLATYHQLRITCKKLRYAMEFFRDVLGNGAGGLIKQVVAMQDQLGNLHDASVAEGLIAEFLVQQARGHAEAAHQEPLEGVAAYLAAQWTIQRELLAAFPPMWSGLTGYDFRRSLSLALAEM